MLVGCLLETYLGFLQIQDPDKTKVMHWGTGNELLDLTTLDDCAAFTVAAALDPEAVGFLQCEFIIRVEIAGLTCLSPQRSKVNAGDSGYL